MSDIARTFVLPAFDPADWYWLAADGRLYGSAAAALVPAAAPAYAAWGADRRQPTVWPSDADGAQSWDALAAVLAALGAPAPRDRPLTVAGLLAYAAERRLAAETAGLVLPSGAEVATDRASQAMISGAVAYLQASGAASVQFKAATGFVTLQAAEMTAIGVAVGAHVQACFAVEAELDAAITASPPSVTTRAAIDAAFAALGA